MKELYNDLHGACDIVGQELGELLDKVEANGGKMSTADLDELDKLTHSIKSVKTTIAMMDAEGGSYRDGDRSERMYNDGYGSYGRRRDSMGRYTRRYDGR